MHSAFGVQLFLARLQPIIESGKLVFSPRNARKTWEFMLSEGLCAEDAINMIMNLKPEHRYRGPEKDLNGTAGAVCSFLYPYKNMGLYIKIKIVLAFSGDSGVILSFHKEDTYD